MRGLKVWFLGTFTLAMGLVAFGPEAFSQAIPKDVGLVTSVKGKVSYWSQEAGREAEAQSFMKVRVGDRFRLEEGSTIRIVFFETSTQETWTGPAIFRVGEKGSEPEAGGMAKPEIVPLPSGAGQKIERIPALLRKAGLARAGGMQVRGALPQEEREPLERPPYDPKESEAKYREMKARAEHDDIAPELFLLGILFEQGRYEEMGRVLDEAMRRRPQDTVLRDLKLWLERRK